MEAQKFFKQTYHERTELYVVRMNNKYGYRLVDILKWIFGMKCNVYRAHSHNTISYMFISLIHVHTHTYNGIKYICIE